MSTQNHPTVRCHDCGKFVPADQVSRKTRGTAAILGGASMASVYETVDICHACDERQREATDRLIKHARPVALFVIAGIAGGIAVAGVLGLLSLLFR